MSQLGLNCMLITASNAKQLIWYASHIILLNNNPSMFYFYYENSCACKPLQRDFIHKARAVPGVQDNSLQTSDRRYKFLSICRLTEHAQRVAKLIQLQNYGYNISHEQQRSYEGQNLLIFTLKATIVTVLKKNNLPTDL